MTDTSTGHTSDYILNREYFSECFDESANTASSLNTYRLAIFFIIVAGVFYVMEIGGYAVWFLLLLGAIELLSIRYKRSWWITRQMFNRAAGSTVNIRIDDKGIFTDNPYHQQGMLWNDIVEIKSTAKGFVVVHNNGSSYLSRSGLDENFLTFITTKIKR